MKRFALTTILFLGCHGSGARVECRDIDETVTIQWFKKHKSLLAKAFVLVSCISTLCVCL